MRKVGIGNKIVSIISILAFCVLTFLYFIALLCMFINMLHKDVIRYIRKIRNKNEH